ncbi:PPE family protein [Mycobacterium bohemicum DSM 44277]|uniref:PPE family protein n=1 Tax=Mycobacterium bohemicum DSM 44277 TaxID=1236609 RepID=A0A0U0W9R4_MYCBE|nr:PPE family protein [Mycobacterium bohemicum]CPR11688.1 PPE family protein [Mycobacterium bohemicum DSM 44277]
MTSPHFAWLPPEINSALIYAGPGAAPLLAAAEAWDGLAENLTSAASSFFSVTSDLVNGSWQGASAMTMMTVATRYVSWLGAAAAQAEAASTQAASIAAAFESAVVATVQPAVVAANRALVQALASTNWFGLNAPAIMDTEAAYEAMWAADVAAMFGYHADASTAVSQLAPWQQVMQKLGFNFNGGQISFGPLGLTSVSNSNVGYGNSGSLNVGSGNSGNNNFGFGNFGNNNFGFGNSGNNDFGIGLSGNNQIGFGGFNSGTGNIGLFNSGSNNIGFFNSGSGNLGIGNAGLSNAGLLNSGSVNAGFFNTGTANAGIFQDNLLTGQASADPLSSGRYLTGGLGAANLSSGLLNSAAATTGGLNPGVASTTLLSPATTGAMEFGNSADAGMVAGRLEASGASMSAAGAASAATGVRAPVREPGIPNSGFFPKGPRSLIDSPPGTGEPALQV